MNAKTALQPIIDGEISEIHQTAEAEMDSFSGGPKLLESCVAVRSSLSHLLAGNSNTGDVDAQLTASLRHHGDGVVGAQVGNLLEYVELYCLASLLGAFRVKSNDGRRGTLWFGAGQLVHAQVGSLTGESAAFEMLSWGNGTLTPVSLPFPLEPTIDSPWQSLILRAEAWRDASE